MDSAELAQLADHYRQAAERLEIARGWLADGIRQAHEAGMRQTDILKATGNVWTREHVRRIVARPGS